MRKRRAFAARCGGLRRAIFAYRVCAVSFNCALQLAGFELMTDDSWLAALSASRQGSGLDDRCTVENCGARS
jgi:hypothetical protein